MTARRKARRRFNKEFKRQAVTLLRESGEGNHPGAEGARGDAECAAHPVVWSEEKTGLSPEELEELAWLRKENARLKMEVEILGKAKAFFAMRNK